MAVKATFRSAAATDPGRRRTQNEDRYLLDPDRGIYAVIDGVGGHAAGERAAELALSIIRERLQRQTGTPEDRLREAIALANNEIYRLSRTRAEWNGMACVLTVALVEEEIVTVGHVGDSRLYLLRPGSIRKVTHDHSPVGEREDRGEITELEAMRHARRNEIYRDVGSGERNPDDPGFIESTSFSMPSDGALLLCSDGLTDLVTSAEIRAGIERYMPDLDGAVHALIDAANHAGGKDNITAVIVSAPDYMPAPPFGPAPVNGYTAAPESWLSRRWAFLIYGILVGVAAGSLSPVLWNRYASPGPRTLNAGSDGINTTLNRARSGDTVVIPAGRYRERVDLREGVTVKAAEPGMVTLMSPDGGAAVVARKLETAVLQGVWIEGDIEAPLAAGIDIVDASPAILNVKITGAATGIQIRGRSAPVITASQIINNPGVGITVSEGARPKIENNLIAANGNGKPGGAKPGIEIHEPARPVLKDNAIVDNAAESIRIFFQSGRAYPARDFEENFFGRVPIKEAIRLTETEGRAGAATPAVLPPVTSKEGLRP